MRWISAFALAVTFCSGQFAVAGESEEQAWARQAISSDPSLRATAIEQLRADGPRGLDALFEAHATAIRQALAAEAPAAVADPAWPRIRRALDDVGGQRDCYASHLFWYTDLHQAQAAAQRDKKPILSLRMLGKLTDEYSCANSRFFRSTLYANAEVGRALRERFVLHWQSVRPVPVVTIDFGDGRSLQRTVTGNSVHYVLDTAGRPIDALPGLYGPRAFLLTLERAEQVNRSIAGLDAQIARQALVQYHGRRLVELRREWAEDLRKVGALATAQPPAEQVLLTNAALPGARAPVQAAKAGGAVPAAKAARVAISKGFVERPILAAARSLPDEMLSRAATDPTWQAIARLHGDQSTLDSASVRLISRQHPTAAEAAPQAVTKWVVEDPLVRMIRKFQQAIALDSVRNEYLLHLQIHGWFVAGPIDDLDALNERVYSELFLTPSSDPWLGLMPGDTYSALENDGVAHGGRP
jgi:hypothetical protein